MTGETPALSWVLRCPFLACMQIPGLLPQDGHMATAKPQFCPSQGCGHVNTLLVPVPQNVIYMGGGDALSAQREAVEILLGVVEGYAPMNKGLV